MRSETVRAFSTLGAGEDTSELRAAARSGSLQERKAASFSLLRWGDAEDRRFIGEMAEAEADPAVRAFLRELLRSPFQSFADLDP